MKDEDLHALRALCQIAGKGAQSFQPEASAARESAAPNRRKLFLKVLGGAGAAVVAIAVFAVNRDVSTPSVTRTPAAAVQSRDPANPACDRPECTSTVSDPTASRAPAAMVVEHSAPSAVPVQPPSPQTVQPESGAATPALTQFEKELQISQPDGSC